MSEKSRWEYKIVVLSWSEGSSESKLNLFGSGGWELVAVNGSPMQFAYLKRAIEQDADHP